MKKNDVLKILSTIDGNPDVRVYCSYNVYDVKNVIVSENLILISVGESNNPPEDDAVIPLSVA
jgi:hypothetical protein